MNNLLKEARTALTAYADEDPEVNDLLGRIEQALTAPVQQEMPDDWFKDMPEEYRREAWRIKEQPAQQQEPVAWTLLLTGENHGLVGKAGEKFVGHPEHYERVDVYTAPLAQQEPESGCNPQDLCAGCRCKYAAQPAQQEPVYLLWMKAHCAWMHTDKDGFDKTDPQNRWVLYKSPQPAQRKPLTAREVELIDGMIEVQLHHAKQCDRIANRTMADKQKGWDMERVELLRKLKEKNI